jgi:hypothetical protein
MPSRLRGVATRLPAHPAPRARGGAAADHGSLGRGDLLLGRTAERGLVHHQLHAGSRGLPHRLPGGVSASRTTRPRPGLRASGLRPPAKQHVSRRQAGRARLASAARERPSPTTIGGNDDQNRPRPPLGARPRRGARVLHPEAGHGSARGCHPAGAGRLPVAHRGPGRPARGFDRARRHPGSAGHGFRHLRAGQGPDGKRVGPAPCSWRATISGATTTSSRLVESSSSKSPRNARMESIPTSGTRREIRSG